MRNLIWNKEMETMPRDELEQLQLERLQSTMNRVYKNVPYYRRLFDIHKIIPEEFTSVKDLQKIPFTTKQILRDNYPYGMLATPLREVVRIHSTSGTTGKPTICAYTRNDLKHWSEVTARVLTMGGVDHDDVVQIAFDYSIFTGGFGFHSGAELIGATVIPTSNRDPEKQIMIIKDYRTTVLLCTPSFALIIAETLEKMSMNPKELSLQYGLFGGEPWSEKLRQEIQNRLLIEATDNYGLSEIIGPGVAGECLLKNGLHIFEDHFIPEIIDPETGEVLPDGKIGELVLTTLTREAAPLIRFRTGDLAHIISGDCPCGRDYKRISRIHARTDDAIIFQGIKFLPSQIEDIISNIEGTQPHFLIELTHEFGQDIMEILVEVDTKIFSDEVKRLVKIEEEIHNQVKKEVGISCKVKLVEPQTIDRSPSKNKLVMDKRPFKQ